MGCVVRENKGEEGVRGRGGDAVVDGYVDVDVDVEGGNEEQVRVLEEVASFEEVVVWGHERVVDRDDGFVRGIEEWIPFAEAVSFFCFCFLKKRLLPLAVFKDGLDGLFWSGLSGSLMPLSLLDAWSWGL